MCDFLVSVIVPVYHVEDYISKCINSLLTQTYKNIEVLIVDDGTDDNSIAIAQNIIIDDPRFKVFSKENGGLSDARNYGLEQASGELITFLDSDDYYASDFISKMVTSIVSEDADIAICDVELVSEKGVLIRKQKSTLSKSIPGREAVLHPKILNMAQNKIFKRYLFNDTRFPVGYFYEDRATTYKLFFDSQRVSFVEEPLFFYVQRENSITKVLNRKKLNDPLVILNEIKCFLQEKNIFKTYKKRFTIAYQLAVVSSASQIACYSSDWQSDFNYYRGVVDFKQLSFYKPFYLLPRWSRFIAVLLFKYHVSIFVKLARVTKKNK